MIISIDNYVSLNIINFFVCLNQFTLFFSVVFFFQLTIISYRIELIGNRISNAYFAHNCPFGNPRSEFKSGMGAFIREKYVKKEWAMKNTVPPEEAIKTSKSGLELLYKSSTNDNSRNAEQTQINYQSKQMEKVSCHGQPLTKHGDTNQYGRAINNHKDFIDVNNATQAVKGFRSSYNALERPQDIGEKKG